MPTLETEKVCPICGNDALSVAHGVVAPFVSALSSLPIGYQTELRCCPTCDLTFFDTRYGEDELSSLYENYRGDIYQRARRHWEPWYSRGLNDAYSVDGTLVDERRKFMMKILDSAGMPAELNCAVDFGGDEGQFFPNVPTGRRIVCDVSGRELPTGIDHIETLAELGDTKADLVIIAHVLEHLPHPLQPLREIRRAIADDGIVYVEVPLDLFRVTPFHASTSYQRYLRRLVRHRFLFVVSDFVSGVWRQFRSAIPRFGVIKQSEHINYFSDRSLFVALTEAGFSVVAEGSDKDAKVGGLRIGSYGVAARPAAASSEKDAHA